MKGQSLGMKQFIPARYDEERKEAMREHARNRVAQDLFEYLRKGNWWSLQITEKDSPRGFSGNVNSLVDEEGEEYLLSIHLYATEERMDEISLMDWSDQSTLSLAPTACAELLARFQRFWRKLGRRKR